MADTSFTTARIAVNTTRPRAPEPADVVPRLSPRFVTPPRGSRSAGRAAGSGLMGDLTKTAWEGRDGAARNFWSLVADDCLSAATTRRTDQ